MRIFYHVTCIIVAISINIHLSSAQLPPRLNIPGAILLPQARPVPFRQQRIQGDAGPPPRLRRPNPIPNPPSAPIRPVTEESEEDAPPATANSAFDDEVSKLGLSVLQSAVRQAAVPDEEAPHPVQFRPERPVPVLRQDIRENHSPPQRAHFRQENRETISRPIPRPERIERPEFREEAPVPVRQPQPIRHAQPRQQIPVQPPPQPYRQQRIQPTRPPPQYLDDESDRPGRTRKPPVQILRKYRTDNADGSITWGYENEDGTFKEETLGVDCVTKGKYGYIDPDGVRREYKYETGNKCDQPEEPEDELVLQGRQPAPHVKKQQFRPPPPQY